MNNPLFSVLIANYNNGRFLQEAIDSVLEQTYPNWEVIIVDDKSTDNSFEIYEKYKDDGRFHIYYNEKNMGCGYTKRRCVELANGDICGFLDSDDALEKDAIEVMVSEHIRYEGVSLVYSRCFWTDSHLVVLYVSRCQCELPQGVSFLEYGRGAIFHFATFKRAYYNQTVGIDVHYKRAVDHALFFLLEEVGSVSFVDKPLYYYRFNTGRNISTNKNTNRAFFWDLMIMRDACRRRGVDLEDVVYWHFEDFVESERRKSFIDGVNMVHSTKTYKVGKRILWPFKKMFKSQ